MTSGKEYIVRESAQKDIFEIHKFENGSDTRTYHKTERWNFRVGQ